MTTAAALTIAKGTGLAKQSAAFKEFARGVERAQQQYNEGHARLEQHMANQIQAAVDKLRGVAQGEQVPAVEATQESA
jgi:hypothetical protein